MIETEERAELENEERAEMGTEERAVRSRIKTIITTLTNKENIKGNRHNKKPVRLSEGSRQGKKPPKKLTARRKAATNPPC